MIEKYILYSPVVLVFSMSAREIPSAVPGDTRLLNAVLIVITKTSELSE